MPRPQARRRFCRGLGVSSTRDKPRSVRRCNAPWSVQHMRSEHGARILRSLRRRQPSALAGAQRTAVQRLRADLTDHACVKLHE